jgi:hypothetical protein
MDKVNGMEERLSLRRLERKAYTSTLQDGLLDILLGLTMFGNFFVPLLLSYAGVSWGYLVPDVNVFTIILTCLAVAVFVGGKRIITVPRIGVARFSPMRRTKLARITAVLVIAALLGVIVGLLFEEQTIGPSLPIGIHLPIVIWIVVAVTSFSLGAYLLDVIRLYVYGALFAAAVPIFVMLRRVGFYTLGLSVVAVSAAIMMAIGIVLLLRFLHEYPKLVEV